MRTFWKLWMVMGILGAASGCTLTKGQVATPTPMPAATQVASTPAVTDTPILTDTPTETPTTPWTSTSTWTFTQTSTASNTPPPTWTASYTASPTPTATVSVCSTTTPLSSCITFSGLTTRTALGQDYCYTQSTNPWDAIAVVATNQTSNHGLLWYTGCGGSGTFSTTRAANEVDYLLVRSASVGMGTCRQVAVVGGGPGSCYLLNLQQYVANLAAGTNGPYGFGPNGPMYVFTFIPPSSQTYTIAMSGASAFAKMFCHPYTAGPGIQQPSDATWSIVGMTSYTGTFAAGVNYALVVVDDSLASSLLTITRTP